MLHQGQVNQFFDCVELNGFSIVGYLYYDWNHYFIPKEESQQCQTKEHRMNVRFHFHEVNVFEFIILISDNKAPNKKSNVDSFNMQSQSSEGNIERSIASKVSEFDAILAEAMMQTVQSVSSSAYIAVSADIPSTPPRQEDCVTTAIDDNKEQEEMDNFDLILEQQFQVVIPSPVKITKVENPLVCALKFFVLGSTPRIALAISIQNLPSGETQLGMQGDPMYNITDSMIVIVIIII